MTSKNSPCRTCSGIHLLGKAKQVKGFAFVWTPQRVRGGGVFKGGLKSIFILAFTAVFLAVAVEVRAMTGYIELLQRQKPVATVRLSYGEAPQQFGDLWLPEGEGPFPVVVVIHGGCWLDSLPGLELTTLLSVDLQKSGYAVWNLEYRRLGTAGAGYPGTFADVAHGVDYLRGLAAQHKLDLAHVTTMGHSAGGHLALWAASRHKIDPVSTLYAPDPLRIETVVTLAGINDLEAYRIDGPGACGEPDTIDRLVDAGGRAGIDVYADTSPARLLPNGARQIIASGAQDPIVPPRFAAAYARKAKEAGEDVYVLTLDKAGHFDVIDPQSSAWAKIRDALGGASQR